MISIGLLQINNSFSGQNYLPYATACLQSYVNEHSKDSSRYRFLPHIYKRMPIHQIVDQLMDADILGISTYVWNEQISLEVARRPKALKPSMLVIFGGPQVPDYSEDFLRLHHFIDLAVHNEGERVFYNILEQFPDQDWLSIKGISFIDQDGAYQKTNAGERMRNLDELPSPFLNGLFDQLMIDNPDENWIGLWETNRGCPFKCTFCDWGSATAAKVTKFDDLRLFRELEWLANHKIEYIFVCDANFGIKKRDIEIAKYATRIKQKKGYPRVLTVQNTKNAVERSYQTQKILCSHDLSNGVTLA
ncbi:MAG: hypothetical protein AAF403_05025, partial [Pseudomonadota bacterium]